MGKGGADGAGGETENFDLEPPTSPVHRQSSQTLTNNAVPSSRVGKQQETLISPVASKDSNSDDPARAVCVDRGYE